MEDLEEKSIKPKKYLSITIIDRKDTEELLSKYVNNNVYILRHKKNDSFKTPDSICVISYISNITNEYMHHVLSDSDYIKSIEYIESLGYTQLQI
jgi:hypothetical protein